MPQTVVHAAELSTPAIIDGLRRGRSYIAEASGVTLELTATWSAGDDTMTAGPGETLVVPPTVPLTVTAAVCGAPGTSLALITAAGCTNRVAIGDSGAGRLEWTATGAQALFARAEVRRPARGRLPSMVALSNPVWLAPR